MCQNFVPYCEKLCSVLGSIFGCKYFLLLTVTEDHPEVQAMVLTALEEAKQMSTSPSSLYAEALERRIKEVRQKSETWKLHLHKLCCLYAICPLSYTITILVFQIEEADTDADIRTGWGLDNFPKSFAQMDTLQQAGILPDILFCLSDRDGNEGTRHRNNASLTSCFI